MEFNRLSKEVLFGSAVTLGNMCLGPMRVCGLRIGVFGFSVLARIWPLPAV